jgi:uncharacterized membrane protein
MRLPAYTHIRISFANGATALSRIFRRDGRAARLSNFSPASLAGDRRGNAVVMTAMLMTVIVGCAALTVDLGSLSHDRRSLQASNDAAVMAAVRPILNTQTYGATPDTSRLSSIITASLTSNGYSDAVIDNAVAGTYCPDPSLAVSARFTAGAGSCSPAIYTGPVPNAVQSNVHVQSPYYFGRIFSGGQSGEAIYVTSLAVGMDEAGFTIGTGLISVNTANSPLLNSVLGGMLGTNLSISAVSYQGLANTQIDALTFLNALATNANVNVATIGNLANASASLGTVLQAEITALNASGTPTGNSADALAALQALQSGVYGNPSVAIGALLNASAYETASAGAGAAPTALSASVNAFQVATAAIQLANGNNSLTISPSGLNLPGLASLSVSATAGTPAQTAFPGGGLGFVGTGATTSQVNMQLSLQVNPVAINVGVASASASLSMPTTVTLASGKAVLTGISCGANPATDAVLTISGTTGIATIETTLTTHIAITLLGLPVLNANVSAPVTVQVGMGGPTALTFTQSDIANHVTKRISSTDDLATSTGSLASSLASQTNASINVQVLGLTLPSGLVTGLTGGITSALSTTIAPLLDTVIDNVASALGVQVGYMDVTATGARCGVPAIVD